MRAGSRIDAALCLRNFGERAVRAGWFMPRLLGLVCMVGVLGFGGLTQPLRAESDAAQSDLQRAIKQFLVDNPHVILDIIRENPDIVFEAADLARAREELIKQQQRDAVIAHYLDALQTSKDAPFIGNPDGDVIIVEFFDYNCPHCKVFFQRLDQLVEDNPDIKVIFREFPILGEASVRAARAALAARKQNKYAEFHEALMRSPETNSEAAIMRIAEKTGLDLVRLRVDMENAEIDVHLQTSFLYAELLNIRATPSMLIAGTFAAGNISARELLRLVEAARESGAN